MVFDEIITQVISAAGFAGALLVVMGWAYWKKDRSEKVTQVALTKLSEKHSKEKEELQKSHALEIKDLSEKRIEDVKRVLSETQSLAKEQNEVMSQTAVTNSEVAKALHEVRRDIRTRNNKDGE